MPHVPDRDIADMYRVDNKTLAEIAASIGKTMSYVLGALDREQVPRRPRGHRITKHRPHRTVLESMVVERRMSDPAIAKEFKVGRKTVQRSRRTARL